MQLDTRYRSIWDKIMGLFVLFHVPESYEKYCKAKSRKKEFMKLMLSAKEMPKESIDNISEAISDFDQKFRTPEVHGTGVLRKWGLTMLSLDETPFFELIHYWNWLVSIFKTIDKIIAAIGEDK